jgi:hypothetical protein
MEYRVVNHAMEYVAADGTHINALEGFWALVKRGIVGQYQCAICLAISTNLAIALTVAGWKPIACLE